MAILFEETSAKVPIPRPPPLFCYDDLATYDVKDAASAGYTDDAPLDGLRRTYKQETYAKLFWARYLGVSDKQMTIAMGLSPHSIDDLEAYNAGRERLTELVDTMRSQAFRPSSYLAKLAQHTVEMHDYQTAVFNLARNEIVLGFACTGETDSERQTRKDKQAAYKDAKNDMLASLDASQSKEVDKASTALDALQKKVRAKAADIDTARKVLQHHEAQRVPWHPHPPLEDSYESLQHMPLPKLQYSEEHDAVVEQIWREVWTRDIGANMLWPVRDAISIPASIKANEDFYRAAWVVFASEMWQYCSEVESRVECERLRIEHVYPNIAAVHTQFFADEPGLEKLQLSVYGEAALKRPRLDMSKGFSFGKSKRQKTAK